MVGIWIEVEVILNLLIKLLSQVLLLTLLCTRLYIFDIMNLNIFSFNRQRSSFILDHRGSVIFGRHPNHQKTPRKWAKIIIKVVAPKNTS